MPEPVKKQRGRPKSQFTESSASTLQSLDRALGILDALSRQNAASLTDIAMRLGIPTATTHRILTTLQKRRFAEFDEDTQTWMVGIEAYRVGTSFLKRTNLLDISRPVMRALMQSTGETANLAVPDGPEVVFIGQVESQNPVRAFFDHGTRTSMHASGTGKAILAALNEAKVMKLMQSAGLEQFTARTLVTPGALLDDLARTRARGWSFDQEERFEGMSCIGAVICDSLGEPIAGVSISGPSNRFADRQVDGFGAQVARAAGEISASIGGPPVRD